MKGGEIEVTGKIINSLIHILNVTFRCLDGKGNVDRSLEGKLVGNLDLDLVILRGVD